MSAPDTHRVDWSRLRLGYNAVAAGLGTVAAPAPLAVLHIAGDEYGVALALLGAAAWLDHRYARLATRALVYATLIATLGAPHLLADLIAWTTGVTS